MIFKAKLLKKPRVLKDYFSSQSILYSRHRPTYPDRLYLYLLSECREKRLAWDAGTGNGQAAQKLSKYFQQIYATDISSSQILNSFQESNIKYTVANEQVPLLKRRSVDLITVAQALHWFDIEIFYAEAIRLLKRYGLIACWSYNLFRY
jgi:Methylase involved in ubiquinone/menaquinone biosynthesis